MHYQCTKLIHVDKHKQLRVDKHKQLIKLYNYKLYNYVISCSIMLIALKKHCTHTYVIRISLGYVMGSLWNKS